MKALEVKIREVEDVHAGEALERHLGNYNQAEREEALLIVGGLIAVDRLKDAVAAETINALARFQQEGRHRALGFNQFADFLTNSPLSPMTKSAFYRAKELLDKEGIPAYNFLTLQLAFPAGKRKLFGRGDIQVDGENVFIRDGDEELVISQNNPELIFQALTAVADKKTELENTVAKQTAELETAVAKTEELETEILRITAAKAVEAGTDPHNLALANLSAAYQVLITEVKNLAPVEREQFRTKTFELIAGRMELLAAAHDSDDWTRIAPKGSPPYEGGVAAASADGVVLSSAADSNENGNHPDAYIESLLDRAADDGDDNDAELIDKL